MQGGPVSPVYSDTWRGAIAMRSTLVVASWPVLRSFQMLVLPLVAALSAASSATAVTTETALRADWQFARSRVTDFGSQAREAHQQTALGYGEV